jgi:hypothetical protein
MKITRVFLLEPSCDIDYLMVWVILFLPLSIWLGIGILGQMNIASIGGVCLTVAAFTLVELLQVSKDNNRSKIPLWIMCLMLFSVVLGVYWK